ncbi:MAG: UvrD-helicase domain-containing protein [Nitrospirae bacterium]|nr:UvrD-helicase domain-containing protein [Nitrospirota bacterium]
MIDYEKELNPQQWEAVRHVEGPLLILAGAGSGKTRVLIYRIAHLVEKHGALPSQILALTFTNKAADEMRSRIESILTREGIRPDGLTMGTFHSVCLRLLRRYGSLIGTPPNFVVYDEDDQEKLLTHALEVLDLSTETNPVRYIHGRIQRLKDRGAGPEKVNTDDFFGERLRKIYEAYEKLLKESAALDFGDLLVYAVRLLDERPEVLEACRRRWSFLEVDEYQDTNAVQFDLLRRLAGPTGNLCVVGDDDQSIYRWRGAELKNILDFERHFKECRVIKLEQNYRSTQSILTAASNVVRRNVGRKGKELWTENRKGDPLTLLVAENESDEAEQVCAEIQSLTKRGRFRPSDMAVFYRTNAQSRVFEEQLAEWGIDYQVIGSLRFYERKEIKDVLAFLRLLSNPVDRMSFIRIVGAVSWGIGDATVGKLDVLRGQKGIDFVGAVETASQDPAFKGRSRTGLERLRAFLERLKKERERLPTDAYPDLATFVVKESGYLDALAVQHPEDFDNRRDNLRQLVTGMKDYASRNPESTLDDYLSYVTLLTRADDFSEGPERVALMTLHCAKGLEFPVVFLVGMEEELFPLRRRDSDDFDLEEERRLFYVGMTRAKDRLYLSFAKVRQLFGSVRYKRPSRFLGELPSNLIEVRGANPTIEV